MGLRIHWLSLLRLLKLLNMDYYDFSKTEFFESSEFDSPDKPGSGKLMQREFMERLVRARTTAGIPFEVNSGFRTPARNRKVGGKADSPHLAGHAADIHVVNSRPRFLILKAAVEAGINRIGIGRTFIHLDYDPSKDPDVTWLY